MASYLRLRANMPERYARYALDDLLSVLDRASGDARVELGAIAEGVRGGERVARLLQMRPDTCLFRSLARYGAVKRAGHRPRFVMGIDVNDPRVGHAWIEIDGVPFLEPGLPAFERTFEHPRRA